MSAVAWVPCSELGCQNGGIQVDIRHFDNISARGYLCPDHDHEGDI